MANGVKKKIVTHSGAFHADEVFGVATLLEIFGEENCEVVRSREPDVLAGGDIVLDVGFVYDPEKNRFDHHQQDGAGERENGIPYASFGLIWKHFGERLTDAESAARIDRVLVQPIDAHDNGVIIFTETHEGLYPYLIQNVIWAFAPVGDEARSFDEAFVEVVAFARTLLRREIIKAREEVEAKDVVERAYADAKDTRVVVINDGTRVKREVATEYIKQYPEPLFFIRRHEDGTWQVVAIYDNPVRFTDFRKPLPERWAGKRDKELQNITGVADAIFCHRGRFMCIAESKEGALALAQKALAD